MKKVFAALLLCLSATSYAALNYAITNAQHELVGSSAALTSGNASINFSGTAAVGQFAVFDVSDGASFNGQLRVTYAADLGTPGNIGSNIMIARTVNSQSLTDNGTFSVLIQQGRNGINNGARLQLDWFQAGTYLGNNVVGGSLVGKSISPVVNFTTYDIDFQQFVRVQKSALSAYQLNGTIPAGTTALTVTDNGSTIQFSDPAPDANTLINSPLTAAEFTTVASSSIFIEVGTSRIAIENNNELINQYSLFIFEMRDPSLNIPLNGPPVVVPEPAVFAGVLGFASLIVVGRRRRLKV